MRHPRAECGYVLADVLVGLVLLGLVILTVYRVYLPTFALSRSLNDRLGGQQDVRLAIDRVARHLHETTLAFGRFRVYPPKSGCTGPYDGCIGFVTARTPNCTGPFQLVDSAPHWQAVIYLWRDTGSNELRLRCDPSTTFPAAMWPATLDPYTVIGTNVVTASFSLEPAGSPTPTSIAIALEEQASTPARPTSQYQTAFFNETVFLPQNR